MNKIFLGFLGILALTTTAYGDPNGAPAKKSSLTDLSSINSRLKHFDSSMRHYGSSIGHHITEIERYNLGMIQLQEAYIRSEALLGQKIDPKELAYLKADIREAKNSLASVDPAAISELRQSLKVAEKVYKDETQSLATSSPATH